MKIKNKLIKLLGGYTEDDFDSYYTSSLIKHNKIKIVTHTTTRKVNNKLIKQNTKCFQDYLNNIQRHMLATIGARLDVDGLINWNINSDNDHTIITASIDIVGHT